MGEEIKVTYYPTDNYLHSTWFFGTDDYIPVKTIAINDNIVGISGGTPIFEILPKLESIYISNSVVDYPTGTTAWIADCPKLSAITGEHPFIQDSRTLSKDGVLLGYAPNGGEVYEVPSNITGIGGYCFARVMTSSEPSLIKSIIIPSSVTTFYHYLTAK